MITQIVPLFAPVIDGVGDYALHLGRHLRERFGLESRFVVCDKAWAGDASVEGFSATGPCGFAAASIAPMIAEARTILLHYVGYGYDPNGTPQWLVDALKGWKRLAGANARLVIVFHEIWSAGPPWRKVFYAAPKQKRLAAELLQLSNHAFTSTIWMAAELEKLKPGGVTRAPIPSGVGSREAASKRARNAPPWRPIFFGQTWTRLPAVKIHRPLLENLMRRGELDCALVMGKEARMDSADARALLEFLPAEKIRILGEVSEENGPEGFAEADFYLSAHAARDACKSSALMAAFACGCPAILPGDGEPTPLEAGKHFVAADRFFECASRLPEIGRAARAWYLANADWEVVSASIARQLGEKSVLKA